MSTILVTAYCVLYLILAKIRLDWAVMFLIAALPTYLIRFTVLDIPFTLLEAMILIAFAVWVFANWRQLVANIRQAVAVPFGRLRRGVIPYPFRWEIVLMLLISYGAMAVAGFSDNALGIWKAYFFEPVLVFILVLNVFGYNTNDANDTRMTRIRFNLGKILWAFSFSALAVSVLAIYQKFTGAWIPNELWAAQETRRVTSFFGYPNAVGLYLAPIVIILFAWLAEKIKNYKQQMMKNYKTIMQMLFIAVVIVAAAISIYFAKSDGALIALAVGLIIFGLFANRKLRIVTLSFFVVASVAIFYFQIVNININLNLADKLTLKDFSGQVRKVQWQETWQMLRDNRILLGSGLANYQQEIGQYHSTGFYLKSDDPEYEKMIKISLEYQQLYWQPLEIYLYPHNIALNFWTELGLLGMLLFLWIIGKFLVQGVKLIRNLDELKNRYIVLGLICSMIVIVVHGIVDVPYFKNDLAVMFWVFVAMLSMIHLGRGGRAVEGATLEKS